MITKGKLMEQSEFGKNLAALRKKKKLTQTELANQLHFTFQSVSNWERGVSSPDIDTILRLAEFFGVSTDELLGKAEKETRTESTTSARAVAARRKHVSPEIFEHRMEYYETSTPCAKAFTWILNIYSILCGLSLFAILPTSAAPIIFASIILIITVILLAFAIALYVLLPLAKEFKKDSVAPKIFIATIPISVLLAVWITFTKSPAVLLVLTLISNIVNVIYFISAWLAFVDKENNRSIQSLFITALILQFTFEFINLFFDGIFINLIIIFLSLIVLFALDRGKKPRMTATYYTTRRPMIPPVVDEEVKPPFRAAEIPASFRAQAFKNADATPSAYTPPDTEFTKKLRRKNEFEEIRLFHPQILPIINVISAFVSFMLVVNFFTLTKVIVFSVILFANAVFFFLAKQGAKKLAADIIVLTLFLIKTVTDAIFLSGISLSEMSPLYDMPPWLTFLTLSVGVAFSVYTSFVFADKIKSWKTIVLNVLSTVFVLATTILITCVCYMIRYANADNVLNLSPAIFFQNLSIIVSFLILYFSKDDRVILRKIRIKENMSAK